MAPARCAKRIAAATRHARSPATLLAVPLGAFWTLGTRGHCYGEGHGAAGAQHGAMMGYQ